MDITNEMENMQSREKKNIIFMRLFPDENVKKQITEACRLHDVKTAIVISGIGQLKSVELGFFKEKGDYAPESFNATFEILSLTGNICKQDNKYILHLHTVVGNKKKNVIGGHFIDGTISVTGEIVLLKIDMDIQRRLDEKTGLEALFLE
jgi:predicted DNA-binding protein with PD1-like motif